MIEVIVAIMLIGIVMTAMTTFLASTMLVVSRQGSQQGAVQLAADGMERVRRLDSALVVAGRGKTATHTQWIAPAPELAGSMSKILEITEEISDPGVANTDGALATVPTAPDVVTVGGYTYRRHWYVGRCWQPKDGPCGKGFSAGEVGFFRVVVAVTWSDQHCPTTLCTYVTSSLVISDAAEPISPGTQVGAVGEKVNLQLQASGGVQPVTWTIQSIPPAGLSMNAAGLIKGTLAVPATSTVTVATTDALRQVAATTFTWTVR